jgi:hypothetical protein
MSVSVSEQSFQYVGILNGVMYRIDPATGRSLEPMFQAEPFKTWPDYKGADVSAPAVAAVQAAIGSDPVAQTAPMAEAAAPERIAEPCNLFPRSGAEPLRAGHPDLWALLVAGTCLEGSAYSSP